MAKTAPLDEYARKRSFAKTPEPAPSPEAARQGPLLFVIQQHAATRLHFDLRLECDEVLKSWAVPKGLPLDPRDKRLAMQTEDHPYAYASFEGIIPPKQYGAGEVIVWDCGPYSPDEPRTWFGDRAEAQELVREGLAKGKLSFQLRGEKLKGSFALVKTKGEGQWLVIKHKDRFARSGGEAPHDRSVLCGATVADMKKVPAHRIDAARLIPCGSVAALPKKLAPMLAEIGDAAFNRDGWMWEPKLDGYRALAFVDAERATLRSRNGLDLSPQFPRLAQELARQGEGGIVLDGEIVVLDAGGRPSFNALQNRAQLKSAHDIAAAESTHPAVFFAFDILHFAGVDLRGATYAERRRYLAQCVLPSALVQIVHASADGVALHEAALASGFEGVVGKRLDSRYEAGRRSGSWLKVKPTRSADFVIGGFTRGKGARAALGSILVGYWDKGKLRYASHVGSGFDDRTLAALKARLAPLARKDCPFHELPESNGPTTWTDPAAVAEVCFHSWTVDDRLRAPVFMRLREDVDAKQVRRHSRAGGNPGTRAERNALLRPLGPRLRGDDGNVHGDNEVVAQLDAAKGDFTLVVEGERIRITNLDRMYWPADASLDQRALTKRDLLRYLAQVAPYMLPHLADRPLTMIRMPTGIRGQRFFQKHWEQEKPGFVETLTVFSGHKDEEHDYLVCNNLPTLLWLAQAGTLEFHVWHSRARPGPDCASKGTDYASSLASLEASVLNYPDWVVFDIDPYIYSGKEAPGAEPELNNAAFEKGKEVAFRLRELLATMSLEAIVKTSGKTGLHVFVPIERALDFDAARHVSELVGRHLAAKFPAEVTVEWSVPKRTGKIFMDYNMNVRGKTLNVAYSPRGEPGAPVSMPMTWEELSAAHPLDFRITNAAQRLERSGDRWRDAYTVKQDLELALKRTRAR